MLFKIALIHNQASLRQLNDIMKTQFENHDNKKNTKHSTAPRDNANDCLSVESLNALEELGEVLRDIRKRMRSEGYEIVDGVVRKIATKIIHEKTRDKN